MIYLSIALKADEIIAKFKAYSSRAKIVKSWFCPGRVNLIGEYTDFNGGLVFPAALELGITAVAALREDDKVITSSLNAEGSVTIGLSEELYFSETDGWANYPKGVIKYLQDEGYKLKGLDVLYYSTLPDGAGLSSSAALEVLTAYMMLDVIGHSNVDKVWLAKLTQKVENEFVGVNCGIMDQFTVAKGKKGHAILLDCDTLNAQYVPFPMNEYKLVIMNTNKRRELSDSKYNERRAECQQALLEIQKNYDVLNLCSATVEQVLESVKGPVTRKRALHVVSENDRVLKAQKALNDHDLKTFGKLMNESHCSLRDNFEVTGNELDAIVTAAWNNKNCIGARMTGAGFGGCAIALVDKDAVKSFTSEVAQAYKESTGLKATFLETSLGEGVHTTAVEELIL